jgi:putative ABC transport system permease protein
LFTLADQSCPAVVVNEEAAELLFGGDTAGRSIQSVSTGILHPIVGVVRSRGPERPPATMYWNGTHAGAGSIADPHTRSAFRAATPESIAQHPGAGLAGSDFEKYVVSDSYFDAMGFTLVAGRWFTSTESSLFAAGCRVALVNRAAATLYFPGGSAVGASIIDSARRRSTVVGIVAAPPPGAFQRTTEPAIYYPLAQDYTPRMTLHLMTGLPPGKAQEEVAKLWMNELGNRIESLPDAGSVTMKSLDTHLRQTALAPLRIALLLVGAAAATATFLSIIGLYGALKDTVRRRRRELAIRISLGAGRWAVARLILGAGARLAVVGTFVGFVATAAVWYPVLQSGGTTLPSPWFLLAGPAVLAFAVLLSTWLPARHATLANPLTLLREEEYGNP